MKKRVLSVILALLLLAVPLNTTARAAITTQNFTVTTSVNTTFTFTKEHFLYQYVSAPNEPLTDVRFDAPLPDPATVGTLMLDTTPVVADKEISVNDLDRLKFVPKTDVKDTDATITYVALSKAGEPPVEGAPSTITVRITEIYPAAQALVFDTPKNTPLHGTLVGTDARGRTLTYEPVEVDGVVTVTPAEAGAVTPNTAAYGYPEFIFTPASNYLGRATFKYKVVASNGESNPGTPSNEVVVTIYVGGRPTAQSLNISVEQNTPYSGQLQASDPERRTLTYIKDSDPKNGTLLDFDEDTGAFTYRPNKDYLGDDSFEYHVSVQEDVLSEKATVRITVSKYSITPVVYADMIDHWAATSAGSLAALGFLKGETISFSTTGTATGATETKAYFRPDEQLTRGEFILWLVSAMRIKPDTSTATVFSDTVPYWLVGPTNAAYHANIVQGTLVNGRRLLKANNPLTRLEAVVMIDRAMTLSTSDVTPDFRDWGTVPGWGQQAVKNLAGYEILKGTPTGYLFPHEMLTRAEAAELLFKAYKEAVLET